MQLERVHPFVYDSLSLLNMLWHLHCTHHGWAAATWVQMYEVSCCFLTNGFCTCTTCSHECRSPWVNPCTDFIRRAFHLPRHNTRCPFPVANGVNHSDLPNTHFTGPVQSCCQSQWQQESAVILKSYKLVLPPIFIHSVNIFNLHFLRRCRETNATKNRNSLKQTTDFF